MKAVLTYHSMFVVVLMFSFWGTPFINVSGTITNSKNGEMLKNVNIFESVNTIGTITDKYGFYKLMLRKGDATIVVTMNGYEDFSQKIVLSRDTVLNVELLPIGQVGTKPKTEVQVTAAAQSEPQSKSVVSK